MKKVQILRATLTLGTVALFFAGCRTTHQAQTDHPQLAPGVTMQDVTFYSAALKREMPYRVFLPAKLVPGHKFPVVYLLHGGSENFRTFSNNSNVSRYAASDHTGGLILVMPEGDNSFYVNAAEKPEDRYQDYLLNDLIAEVEARFPVATGRENRAIVGTSMGGFGATRSALTRPDLFFFAGALSPSIDITHRHYALMVNGMWPWIRSIFGPWGSKTREQNDPFLLVQTADPARTPFLYLTVGEQEPLLDSNRRFASLLHDRHFAYQFHTNPGEHDWADWNAELPGCFESLFQHLPPAL